MSRCTTLLRSVQTLATALALAATTWRIFEAEVARRTEDAEAEYREAVQSRKRQRDAESLGPRGVVAATKDDCSVHSKICETEGRCDAIDNVCVLANPEPVDTP